MHAFTYIHKGVSISVPNIGRRPYLRTACLCPFLSALFSTVKTLQRAERRPSSQRMVRVSVFLVFLLLVLTFNAYVCVCRYNNQMKWTASSGTEGPVRGACDVLAQICTTTADYMGRGSSFHDPT